MRCEAKHLCSPSRVFLRCEAPILRLSASFLSFFHSFYLEYASKIVILCRDDLENGKSENIGWNVSWKYRHWTYTIRSQIFPKRSSLFTNSSTKTQIRRCPHFTIIKTKTIRKVRRDFLSTTDFTADNTTDDR
jgi:hypothetical protein